MTAASEAGRRRRRQTGHEPKAEGGFAPDACFVCWPKFLRCYHSVLFSLPIRKLFFFKLRTLFYAQDALLCFISKLIYANP
jgi:hypothetical protein